MSLFRYCTDCRHKGPGDAQFSYCNAPQNQIVNPVSGVVELRYSYCSIQRDHGFFAAMSLRLCGTAGYWFEPKAAKGAGL